MRERLDNYEKAIIHYLSYAGESNTNEIAGGVDISWATANNRIKKLYGKGYVRFKRGCWRLRF